MKRRDVQVYTFIEIVQVRTKWIDCLKYVFFKINGIQYIILFISKIIAQINKQD